MLICAQERRRNVLTEFLLLQLIVILCYFICAIKYFLTAYDLNNRKDVSVSVWRRFGLPRGRTSEPLKSTEGRSHLAEGTDERILTGLTQTF